MFENFSKNNQIRKTINIKQKIDRCFLNCETSFLIYIQLFMKKKLIVSFLHIEQFSTIDIIKTNENCFISTVINDSAF